MKDTLILCNRLGELFRAVKRGTQEWANFREKIKDTFEFKAQNTGRTNILAYLFNLGSDTKRLGDNLCAFYHIRTVMQLESPLKSRLFGEANIQGVLPILTFCPKLSHLVSDSASLPSALLQDLFQPLLTLVLG